VILHDPKGGTYLRLSAEGLAIYEDLDGDRSLRELAMRHAERTGLEERISKTDLSAAVSVKTASPMLHAPSETRR
jgi:hypothetical protein